MNDEYITSLTIISCKCIVRFYCSRRKTLLCIVFCSVVYVFLFLLVVFSFIHSLFLYMYVYSAYAICSFFLFRLRRGIVSFFFFLFFGVLVLYLHNRKYLFVKWGCYVGSICYMPG